ncbi:unnamed protein product [Amoebophrya sp. A25]|nr:unnamed protein product [Amoebophrya sp. A25]|eukprot:GSA25T00006988001.1
MVASRMTQSQKFRILCLHPKNSNAILFNTELSELQHVVKRRLADTGFEADGVEWHFVDAPNLVKLPYAAEQAQADGSSNDGPGRVWWHLPDGHRSYTAEAYFGDDKSLKRIEDALSTLKGQQSDDATSGYDGILGFSQGAMMAAIIAARNVEKLKFALLFGAALPKPYENFLEEFRLSGPSISIRISGTSASPSTSTTTTISTTPSGSEASATRSICSVLSVLSKKDTINPPEMGEWVGKRVGGEDAKTIWHDEGHVIPTNSLVLEEIAAWLLSFGNLNH